MRKQHIPEFQRSDYVSDEATLRASGFEDSFIPCFGSLIKFDGETVLGYNIYHNRPKNQCVLIKAFDVETYEDGDAKDWARSRLKTWHEEQEGNKGAIIASCPSGRGKVFMHGRTFSVDGDKVFMDPV